MVTFTVVMLRCSKGPAAGPLAVMGDQLARKAATRASPSGKSSRYRMW